MLLTNGISFPLLLNILVVVLGQECSVQDFRVGFKEVRESTRLHFVLRGVYVTY